MCTCKDASPLQPGYYAHNEAPPQMPEVFTVHSHADALNEPQDECLLGEKCEYSEMHLQMVTLEDHLSAAARLREELMQAEDLLWGKNGCTGMMKLMANRLDTETRLIVGQWLNQLEAFRRKRALAGNRMPEGEKT